MAEYQTLLEKQDGKCLICEATVSYMGHRLAVDHDHADGHIRGLLCKACNAGLGHFQDDPERIMRAAQYLLNDKVNGNGNGH